MQLLSATWTGDSGYTTSISGSFEVYRVSLHYDATITNNATVKVDREAGANYDELVTTFDNSGGVTDNSVLYDRGLRLGTGDQLAVACNVGANNAYLTIDWTPTE